MGQKGCRACSTGLRDTRRGRPPLLAALVVAAVHLIPVTESAIVAVYSIQRHGARNVLPKSIYLTENDLIGGPTLLPKGQFQTYSAGSAFRARYLNPATCNSTCLLGGSTNGSPNGINYGVANQPGIGFGNFDVYVRSSSLDRTILSANCFFNGIFPAVNTITNDSYLPTGAQMVPIYTQGPDADDILIRAYTKCPAYQQALAAWYGSTEFSAKADSSAALRAAVKAAMPSTDTSLQNWWNVYDSINVYQTYGVGDPVPFFNATMFSAIQDLAYWLETSKMRSNLTGNLLGGLALADVRAYLAAAAEAVAGGDPTYYRLLSLSGHYNTQLGLLAALQLDQYDASKTFPWFRSIPKLAAVMVFELHTSASGTSGNATSFFVRLVAQDGYAANYTGIPLPCASDAAAAAVGPGACSLGDFVGYVAPRVLATPQAWCTACGNQNVSACAVAKAQAQVQALQAAAQSGSSSASGHSGCGTEAWQIAVSVVVTFVGTLLVGAVGLWLWSRRGIGAGAASEREAPFGLQMKALDGGEAPAGSFPYRYGDESKI